jgi:hypothetical protein
MIMSSFRIKETLIYVPKHQVALITMDLIHIIVTNIGTQALLEEIEDWKYDDIRFNHMNKVYGKEWLFGGIPLNILLKIQIIFSTVRKVIFDMENEKN